MDNFRKYIQENAGKLDCEAPSAKVLEAVRIHMRKNRKSTFRKLLHNNYTRAACLIGILASIVVFSIKTGREKINPTEIALTPETRVQPPQTVETLTSKDREEEVVEKQKTMQNKSLTNKTESKGDVKDHEDSSSCERASMPQPVENDIDFAIGRYVKVINTTPLLAEPPAYFAYFVEEYKRIGQTKSAIEESIQKHGASDVLFQQLVNIGQQKLKILKDLEREIHKTNSFYEGRTGLNETEPLYIQL